jgi:hypothetical protein
MSLDQQTTAKTILEVSAVSAINVASWGLQDSVELASLVLSVCTTIWIITQLIRFIQKWIREEAGLK